MVTYPFNLDTNNLEVFPPKVWQDPFVVFHGTSSTHSLNIETNGFLKSYSPYDLDAAKELVRILQLPQIEVFDTKSIVGMTQAETLKDYINAIEKEYFRLSFSYLSSLCVLYATGLSKGGQTVGTIRRAKEILDNAIAAGKAASSQITKPISSLFHGVEEINNSEAVVYAVRLPQDLNGITIEGTGIHSTVNIPANSIIGKTVIPNDFDIKLIDIKVANSKRTSKLFGVSGLASIQNRRDF